MKKNLFLIIIITLFIISLIVLANNLDSEEEKAFYAYVKENKLILWDKNSNQKYLLSKNVNLDNKNFPDNFFSYSYLEDKIIYIDNITAQGADLYFIDIADLGHDNYTLIANNVTSYQVTESGLIYLKDSNLFYFDYNTSTLIDDDVSDYTVSKDKKNIYYCNKNGDVYLLKDIFQKNKILTDIDGLEKYDNFIIFYKKENFMYSFYIDDELIGDKILTILGVFDNAIYFTQYEGNLTEFDDNEAFQNLNLDVATYKYQNGQVTRIGPGIMTLSEEFTNPNNDEYLVLGKYNGKNFDIFLYNQKNTELTSLGNTLNFNFYAYDDTTKTIYYREANLFYQSTIIDGELKNKKLIGNNISYISKKNGKIYYVENDTSNLYLLENNELIAENINDWYIIDNIIFYNKNVEDKFILGCYQCQMNEINNIAGFNIRENQIFYYLNTYNKDNILYGDLYTIINGISTLVDDNIIISFGVIDIK